MKFGKGRVPSTSSRAVHTFASVPQATIPRSVFNRSHGHKTTFDEGYLVPVFLDEILPGDTYNLKMTAFGRLSTPIFPLMDNMYLDVHFFFVPCRLVWTNWERFNGAQDNTNSSTDFTIPQMVYGAGGVTEGTLGDYFGLPLGVANQQVNALPFRCYNLIYNTWYRDQNMQNSVTVDVDDGTDAIANYVLLRRGKRHDYFTSCLPWPQKVNDGSTLNLPLGGNATVIYNDSGSNAPIMRSNTSPYAPLSGDVEAQAVTGFLTTAASGSLMDPNGTLIADLSTATGVTINELREAFQIQKMFERDARGGTRYTEIIHSHFGVTSPDARLQRPEYLGGGSSSINITPIPQTSATSGTNYQGNLAAFGTLSLSNAGFIKSFTEHGYVLGLASVRADLNYQQGLRKLWSRSTRYDFYWPALSHIGEQAVLRQEIYCTGTDDDVVFGYQERYGEYRYFPGQITGLFRTAATGTLDSWHLAQQFGSAPTLNGDFIVENAPMARVLASGASPHFLFDSYFSLKCARPMPTYAVPGLIDHF